MTITTDRGKTATVNWAWAEDGVLRIELPVAMTVMEVAADYGGVTRVERTAKNEGNDVYEGYSVLTNVIIDRRRGTTRIALEKE